MIYVYYVSDLFQAELGEQRTDELLSQFSALVIRSTDGSKEDVI